CSKDDTVSIINGFMEKYPDKIHLYKNEQNLGLVLNNWKAFKLCKGKYIAILDSDDYWTYPLKLKEQTDVLEEHEDHTMIYCDGRICEEDTETDRKFVYKKTPESFNLTFLLQNANIWNSS